jgi:hypothetical protein
MVFQEAWMGGKRVRRLETEATRPTEPSHDLFLLFQYQPHVHHACSSEKIEDNGCDGLE